MSHSDAMSTFDLERAVRERYSGGAERPEPDLCCPADGYDARYLAALPREIVERDYGCGDPSRWVGEGETVIDLGSGSGKAAYILAQKVGPRGRVIGVDFNEPMLALARKHQEEMARKLGYANTRFAKARIQDLALDLDRVESWLMQHPARDLAGIEAFEAECARLRRDEPFIADATADVVVSNCVLNLVRPEDKRRLFGEIFRVLRRGGRAVISDIVCDEEPTDAMRADSALWSGCLSGAFLETGFLLAFEEAGFHGIEILSRSEQPWRTIEGIEFRAITVRAFTGKQGPCLERLQAVVYKGPWKKVVDDDGHTFLRGERVAVCDKTFHLMTGVESPYAAQILAVEPRVDVPLAQAATFACRSMTIRAPHETKGQDYRATTGVGTDPCSDEGCC